MAQGSRVYRPVIIRFGQQPPTSLALPLLNPRRRTADAMFEGLRTTLRRQPPTGVNLRGGATVAQKGRAYTKHRTSMFLAIAVQMS